MRAGERYTLCFEPNKGLLEALRSVDDPAVRRQLIGERALLLSKYHFEVPEQQDRVNVRSLEQTLRGVYTRPIADWLALKFKTPPIQLPVSLAYPEDDTLMLAVDVTGNSLFTLTPEMRDLELTQVLRQHQNGDKKDTILHLETSIRANYLGEPCVDLRAAIAEQRDARQFNRLYPPRLGVVFRRFIRAD